MLVSIIEMYLEMLILENNVEIITEIISIFIVRIVRLSYLKNVFISASSFFVIELYTDVDLTPIDRRRKLGVTLLVGV